MCTASENIFKLDLADYPHKPSSLPVPNPVVRFEDLSEDDRQELFAKMNDLTMKIYKQFLKLTAQVCASLEAQHKYVVLTLTKDDIMLFDDDIKDKLRKSEDIYEVFDVISPHFSYFNYDLFELLVDVHGAQEDKKYLEGYLKSFASYCQAMPCAEEICGSDDSRSNRIKLKFKLNFDRQRFKVDQVKNITRNISRILNIKAPSLYLRTIKEGCVSLEFLIPSFLIEHIFPLSNDQKVSLYREVNVTDIECDQPSLHVVSW